MIDGDRLPDRISGYRLESDQSTVQRPDIDFPAIKSGPAVDDVTADDPSAGARNLGIVGPPKLASLGIHGVDHAPRTRRVDHARDDEGCSFESPRRTKLSAPYQAESLHVVHIDLAKGTEPLLVVSPSVHQPVGGVTVGLPEPVIVDAMCLVTSAAANEEHGGQEDI